MSNLTDDMDAALVVRDAIQRVYGDATQTVLDQRAASEIVKALRAAGWASLDDVARLIEAAGGSITIPGKMLGDDRRDRMVTVQDDFATMGKTLRVSVSS